MALPLSAWFTIPHPRLKAAGFSGLTSASLMALLFINKPGTV